MSSIVVPERPAIWTPSPKQEMLLACDDFEVLYGGAAGGGKSDALLIDAWCLQHNGPANKNHRAILFRRNYKNLLQLMERAEALYPQFIKGVKFSGDDLAWETPAGAKLQFAYLENDRDRFNWRGWAGNYVGFEELTTWPTDKCYTYMSSRCRTVDKTLPRYLRATTNPDGPGQRWVMERFGIGPEGKPTRIEREVEFELEDGAFETRKIVRRFIPALLKDNQYLRGSGYRETLMDLTPDEREALLEGKWTGNRVQGAIFLREMQKVRSETRIKKLPILTDVPVNTFWDMGWNDANAVWWHQYAALENRFLHSHQQSGMTLADRVAYLQKWQADHGVIYGTHYLPHDADKRSEKDGKSMVEVLRALWPGQRFVIVPRATSKVLCILQTRSAFANCYFDVEECSDGIAALDAYRWMWSESQQVFTDAPYHGPESNYADAFQQFGQGYAPKQQRVKTPDSDDGDPRARRREKRHRGSWRSA